VSDTSDIEDRVRRYIAAVAPDGADPGLMRLERLQGVSQRNAVFRVSYVAAAGPTTDVVVRLWGEEPGKRESAEREARLLAILDGQAAPRLLDFQHHSPLFGGAVMCLSYVDGVVLSLGELSPHEIRQLATVVGELHARPVGVAELGYSPTDEVSLDVNLLTRLNVDVRTRALGPPTDAGADVMDTFRRAYSYTWTTVVAALGAEEWFRPRQPLAVLHGDVSSGNVAWGPKPVLIDWEDWRIGDPAEEVAYIFMENNLNDDQQQAFWDAYGGAVGRDAGAVERRVSVWAPVTLLGSAAWWLERCARPGARSDVCVDEALTRLRRFERLFLPEPRP
jgi:Ser/Thr protein kinase RdoA (MazF antagonist)